MAKRRETPIRPETVNKYIDQVKELIAFFLTIVSTLHVRISHGNKKIGRVHNVSLAPIITCGNCSGCHNWCYDIKACLQYLNVRVARAVNTAIYRADPERYFSEIDQFLSRKIKNKYYRWHVGGEIPDYKYFCFMVDLARKHPDWRFWTYTKMYFIVNKFVSENGGSKETAIPDNLSIMFSIWDGMPVNNPYGFGTFRCVMDGSTPEEWKCPGNCDVCKEARRGCPYNESSYTLPH